MTHHKCRSIAIWTIAVGILSILASSTAQAQQAPDAPPQSKPAVRTPPPNPKPPQAGATPFEPGYLGVVADDQQEKGAGVRVVELEPGAPAEQAGLKTNDLITRIDHTPIHAQADMGHALERLAPGTKVKFAVDRGGQQQTIEVTLGTRPPPAQRRFERFGAIPEPLPTPHEGGGIGPNVAGAAPGQTPRDAAPNALPNLLPPDNSPRLGNRHLPGIEPSHRPLLGVRTQIVTEEARRRLKLPSVNGALVVSRTLGSPAAKAGIPLNAVITAVDGKPIGSPPDLTQLVAQAGPGHDIEIAFYYGGTEQRVKVKLAEVAAGPSTLSGGGSVGGNSVNPGEVPLPPSPQTGRLPVSNDKIRIEALERHMQQLEHRIDDLEQALRKSS